MALVLLSWVRTDPHARISLSLVAVDLGDGRIKMVVWTRRTRLNLYFCAASGKDPVYWSSGE